MDWRSRLEEDWPDRVARLDPDDARETLGAEHAAEARPDPDHVHPTWWCRALREESPAVRQAVAAHAPEPIARALRRGLNLDSGSGSPRRPPHPEALAWVLTLWSERLVGGPSHRESDPPVVRALARLDGRGQYRLLSTIGLAKRRYAGAEPPGRRRDRHRFEAMAPSMPPITPELAEVARADLSASGDGRDRHVSPRLGLISIGRLLVPVEPHRARWALQHLPYEAAKRVRSHMNPAQWPRHADAILAWESSLLRVAITQLFREGRIEPIDAG